MTSSPNGDAKAPPRFSLRQKVLQRFVAGILVDDIAEELGMRPKRVEKTLSEELKKLVERPATDFVKVQLERIERVLAALSKRMEKGELRAIDTYLRALDRAQRYYGFLQKLGVEYRSTAADGRAAI